LVRGLGRVKLNRVVLSRDETDASRREGSKWQRKRMVDRYLERI